MRIIILWFSGRGSYRKRADDLASVSRLRWRFELLRSNNSPCVVTDANLCRAVFVLVFQAAALRDETYDAETICSTERELSELRLHPWATTGSQTRGLQCNQIPELVFEQPDGDMLAICRFKNVIVGHDK